MPKNLAVIAAPALSLTVLACSVASGQTYPIVDTGQDHSYDAAGAVITPGPGDAFFGQDTQHDGNQPSYTISADGLTVLDNVTGLTWTKSPDLNGDGAIDINDKMSWEDAGAYVATLNAEHYGGFDDWRLPTIKELYSLMNFNGVTGTSAAASTPYIDTTYFDFGYGDEAAGDRFIDAQLISATSYVSTTMNGDPTFFGLNMADGRIKGYPKVKPTGEPFLGYVRFVRGNTSYGVNDFQDNGDGTVTDAATGLMWTQDDSGVGMDWQDALAYAQQKNAESYLGHDDWRLPNAKELQSIVDYTRSPDTTNSAAIDPVFSCTAIIDEGGATDYPFYWTSTTHLDGPVDIQGTFAVYVCFGEALGWMPPPFGGDPVLLDVHGAGAQRSDPKEGDPADWPEGNGPQGDVVRIFNFVRLVRDVAPPFPACPGDLDGDADTDIFDFGMFALNFGTSGLAPYTGGDMDGDGDVDVLDFGVFAGDFGCLPN